MDNLAMTVLLAVGIALYGAVHGSLIAWTWRNREHLMIPTLLLVSPFGVGICLLAAVPFVGWQAALTVAAALGIGFVPVAIIVGWAMLSRQERGL